MAAGDVIAGAGYIVITLEIIEVGSKQGMEEVLICEDSQEGIFTAIYEAYALKCRHEDTRVQLGEEENLRLFANYRHIETEPEKAWKVGRTIVRRFGRDTYEQICYCLSSMDREKGQAVYRTLAAGLSGKVKGALLDNLGDPYVHKVFTLSRSAGFEAHHLLGFVRFRELKNGSLYSDIGPKNNVVPFLMPHFADRLPGENFVICDKPRGIYGVHPAGEQWFLIRRTENDSFSPPENSDEEEQMQELFKHFCVKISIKERENRKLQRQMLPLRFQEYMTEFVKNEQKQEF